MKAISAVKKSNYIFVAIIVVLFLYCWLPIFDIQGLTKITNASIDVAQITIPIHFVILYILYKVYRTSSKDNKAFIFIMLVANVCLLLNDFAFYMLVFYTGSYKINILDERLIFDMIPYTIWIISFIVFLSKIIVKSIYKLKKFIHIFSALATMSAIIIALYLSSIHYEPDIFSWQSALQTVCTTMELLIFGLAILCLIYCESMALAFILISMITLIASDFIINYSYLSHSNLIQGYGSFGSLLWDIGLVFMLYGAFVLNSHDKVDVKSWLSQMNSIKNKMAIWAFFVSIISILPFFILAYFFFPENKKVFIILPPFIMMTTVMIVALARLASKNLDRPFKEMAENISNLMLNDDKIDLKQDLYIKEFIFLQKFIYDAYDMKRDRDRVKVILNEVAKQTAHDIRSPTAAILMLAKESMDMPEGPRVILRDAAHRIQDIANNLLDKSREPTALPMTTVSRFLVSTAVLSVISEKRVEYTQKPITIVHEFAPCAIFCFIHANPMEFKRALSNLLNNALEAISCQGIVTVKLTCDDHCLHVDIIDSGKGMSPSMIDAVMRGESVSSKPSGLGLGLSHTRTFLQACDGQLGISSSDGRGTTISLMFNKLREPSCWLANEIKFTRHSLVIILDDDLSIHGAWDSLLGNFFKEEDLTLQIVHFTSGLDCLTFIKQLETEQFGQVVLLADYELIKQNLNGLDVIEQSQLDRAILVTSYDEDPYILKRAVSLNTKILPKQLISEVQLTLLTPLPMSQDSAELVIVEDNKVFSEVVAYLYEYRGKKLDTYHGPYSLFDSLYKYDKLKTKFCLDYDLGYIINGIELAAALHKRGFMQLYLASGYQFEVTDVPPYLQVLTNKMELLNL